MALCGLVSKWPCVQVLIAFALPAGHEAQHFIAGLANLQGADAGVARSEELPAAGGSTQQSAQAARVSNVSDVLCALMKLPSSQELLHTLEDDAHLRDIVRGPLFCALQITRCQHIMCALVCLFAFHRPAAAS